MPDTTEPVADDRLPSVVRATAVARASRDRAPIGPAVAATRPLRGKPWPTDVVIVIAEDAGREARHRMEAVVPASCRDCGQDLGVDIRTIRMVRDLPSRCGRPVEFLCVFCRLGYDPDTVTELHDARGPAAAQPEGSDPMAKATVQPTASRSRPTVPAEPTCPVCGCEFNTGAGMASHVSRSHAVTPALDQHVIQITGVSAAELQAAANR